MQIVNVDFSLVVSFISLSSIKERKKTVKASCNIFFLKEKKNIAI